MSPRKLPWSGGREPGDRRWEDYETLRLGERENQRITLTVARSRGLHGSCVPRLSAPFRAFPCIKIFPLLSHHRPWTLDLGPLDLGLWTLDFGPWTLDLGLWTPRFDHLRQPSHYLRQPKKRNQSRGRVALLLLPLHRPHLVAHFVDPRKSIRPGEALRRSPSR